jgi:hypothetical protein
MPAGQGKDAERFAAAVESRTPLGPADDADLARELEIVAMLRSRGADFAPDAETKARAKERLMAVLAAEHGGPRPVPRPAAAPPVAAELTTPMGRVEREEVDSTAQTELMAPITAEDDATGAGTADDDTTDDATSNEATAVEPIPLRGPRSRRGSRHTRTDRAGRSAAAGLRTRVVLVGAAAASVMLAIAGGGVLVSSDALPGDSLYPVKRVAESAGLALTFDEASRARRHLEIATIRLSEVEQLARNTQAAPAPEVFTAAMDDFDAATDEGSRMLLEAAKSDQASTAADDLRKWATTQSERLTEIEPDLPDSVDAEASKELLERLLGQTGQDDADSRSADDEDAPESDAPDASEDATSTPDEEDSTRSRETDEPSRTPTQTTDQEDPGLLPDLVPDSNRENDEEPTTTSGDEDNDSDSGDEGDNGKVEVPLPLVPPVELPPLVPGVPGITIG